MAAEGKPDLVILCSRKPDTVTARVYRGVLTWRRGQNPEGSDLANGLVIRFNLDDSDMLVDWRNTGGKIMHQESVECRCGRRHGPWAPQVIRGRLGKISTDEVEQLTQDLWDALMIGRWTDEQLRLPGPALALEVTRRLQKE